MSDLHAEARALIRAAKRKEASLSADARARVHRSVLRRAAAFGAALASTTTASVAAKGSVLATILASPLVSTGVVGALGGVALLVARSAWMAPVPPQTLKPPIAVYTGHRASTPATQSPGALSVASPIAAPARSATSMVLDPTPASALATAAAFAPLRSYPPAPPSASTPVSALPIRPAECAAAPPRHPPRGAAAVEPGQAVDGLLPESSGEASSVPSAAQPTATRALAPLADIATALDILHRAHAALRAGQPERALELLRGGAAVLDSGPFSEEAQAARASALCQTGRAQEARAAIDRFLVVWPDSVLATRLRQGCSALGGIGVAHAK
jgi:hypothetical protein